MFTLAISCLTTSNLPWFMDLTFQAPMQYSSLQHQSLLLSPVTARTGYCFCFGCIPSFFLELFLHWSPVAYWAPTDLGSSPDVGRDWGQEKRTTENEMAGWHHWLDGHEPEWTPGIDDGQGGLACCNSWGHKESDTTERLNWTELKNAKASFWSLKEYKVFYTKFHSAQQNELYALIQVICLHPYPINIVSDSTYCFCIKKI